MQKAETPISRCGNNWEEVKWEEIRPNHFPPHSRISKCEAKKSHHLCVSPQMYQSMSWRYDSSKLRPTDLIIRVKTEVSKLLVGVLLMKWISPALFFSEPSWNAAYYYFFGVHNFNVAAWCIFSLRYSYVGTVCAVLSLFIFRPNCFILNQQHWLAFNATHLEEKTPL